MSKSGLLLGNESNMKEELSSSPVFSDFMESVQLVG